MVKFTKETETEVLTNEEVDIEVKKLMEQSIILYNDEVNSFDHVIRCLVEHCNHQVSQAEQCALIVHTKGKCSVKNGSFEELKPICEALLMEGLTAEIF
jgi:ATP-dependent Clp protease adaptor protein ClpS